MENDVSLEIVDTDVSKNAASLEGVVGDGESNDISLENVGPETNKSSVQPTVEPQQDPSFITPTELVDFVLLDGNTTKRHSERIDKPTQSPDCGASGNVFCEESWNANLCLDTPDTPKTTSTPKILSTEFDTPSLESVCSDDDSLDRYMPIHEVLQVSSLKTPIKSLSLIIEKPASKNEPRNVGDAPNKGPSLCRSQQSKYVASSKNPSDEAECSSTASSTSEVPNCKVTSTPKIYHDESEVVTLASPCLEAGCSNDSFNMNLPLSKVASKISSGKIKLPSNHSGSGHKPSEITPNEASNPKIKGPPSKTDESIAKTTLKRRIHHTDSSDDTSASADLKLIDINDSLEIPITFHRDSKVCLKKTLKKQLPSRTSGSKYLENVIRASSSRSKRSSSGKYRSNNINSRARNRFNRIYDTDSDGSNVPPCDLEAIDSNNSADIFPVFRQDFEACARKTPSQELSPSSPDAPESNPPIKESFPHTSFTPNHHQDTAKTQKPVTIFKRMFGYNTQDSPKMETLSSNDSLLIPPTKRKAVRTVQTSTKKPTQSTRRNNLSRKKPSKYDRKNTQSAKRRLGSTPNNTPTKGSSSESQGPSPYKYCRPKYLPKNIKLVKRKRQQRKDFLKEMEILDAQLIKLPALVLGTPEPVNPVLVSDDDLMGTQTPIIVYFHPERFFVSFDEYAFDRYFDVNIAKLARSMRLDPLSSKVKDYRNLTLFLTVTSDLNVFNIMSCQVEDDLITKNFVLDFEDLKTICRNWGLTKEPCKFDDTYFNSIDKKAPKPWNLAFFFMVVEHSFPSYKKSRLLRLLNFMGCCLFDPMLQQFQSNVYTLIQHISEHLILRCGATLKELVIALDHKADSWICNRMIVQILSSFPVLRPAATALAYHSIKSILQAESEPSSLSHVADLLADVYAVRKKIGVKDVYQLIIICETLVVMGPSLFDCDTKTFLKKLVDFAENISFTCSYFENLLFMDTVNRLKTLSIIEGF